jgi:molecular chaperone DnaJ
MAGKDFYKTLDVPENASADVIKKAYRRLAKKYHPDANHGSKEAEAIFKDVSEAYGVLSDPKKRAQYDQMRKYGGSPFGGGQGFPGGFGQGGFRMEDLGFGSFGDLFSSIFGDIGLRTHSRKHRRQEPSRGANLSLMLKVSFQEAMLGAKKTIRLRRDEACQKCGGKGTEPGSGQTTCPECKGSGMVSMSQGMFSISRPCPRCFGTGQIMGKPCSQCSGQGKVKGAKTIAVKIPAGIKNGQKIRLKGMGNAGMNGNQYGDLIISINVQPDPFFRKDGLDLFCDVRLTLKQAINGVKIKVRTLSGHAMLKIPALTKDGSMFKLKGQGIKEGRESGDQYVQVKVKLPSDPNEEEKEMIARLEGEKAKAK